MHLARSIEHGHLAQSWQKDLGSKKKKVLLFETFSFFKDHSTSGFQPIVLTELI